jgi:hypothetical protein
MEMKKEQLYEFYEGLMYLNLTGSRFTYAITKNKRKVEQAIKEMDKERKPSKNYEKFLEKLEENKKYHALKDEKGKFVLIDGNGPDGNPMKFYDIPEKDNPEGPFLIGVKALEEEYKDVIAEQKEKEKKFIEQYLQEESDYEPFKVNISDVPKEITQKEMDLIYWMIDENER